MEKPAANWSTHSYIAVTAIKNKLIGHCCQIHGKFYILWHYGVTVKRTLDERTESNLLIKPRECVFYCARDKR